MYLESLDSTRGIDVNLMREDHAGLIKTSFQEQKFLAKLQMSLALLHGYEIIVPETYAFDSATFVDLANELLSAKEAVMKRKKQEGRGDHTLFDGIPNSRLFRVALRGDLKPESFDELLMARYSNPNFTLSLFPDIGGHPLVKPDLMVQDRDAKRKKFIESFLSKPNPKDCLGELPGRASYEHLVQGLGRLRAHLRNTHCLIQADNKPELLGELMAKWAELPASRGSSSEEKIQGEVKQWIKDLPRSGKRDIALSRSALWTHGFQEFGSKPELLGSWLEVVDNCYNLQLSRCCRAEFNQFSTLRDPELAGVETADATSSPVGFGDTGVGAYYLAFDRGQCATETLSKALSFEVVLEVMLEKEWREKCAELHGSLRMETPAAGKQLDPGAKSDAQRKSVEATRTFQTYLSNALVSRLRLPSGVSWVWASLFTGGSVNFLNNQLSDLPGALVSIDPVVGAGACVLAIGAALLAPAAVAKLPVAKPFMERRIRTELSRATSMLFKPNPPETA